MEKSNTTKIEISKNGSSDTENKKRTAVIKKSASMEKSKTETAKKPANSEKITAAASGEKPTKNNSSEQKGTKSKSKDSDSTSTSGANADVKASSTTKPASGSSKSKTSDSKSGSSAKKTSLAKASDNSGTANKKSTSSKSSGSNSKKSSEESPLESITGTIKNMIKKEPEDPTLTVLNQVYQNAQSGKKSIGQVITKIEDENLKKELIKQYSNYDEISSKSSTEIMNMDEKPKEKNPISKALLWGQVSVNTLVDNSPSNIADMVIKNNYSTINDLERSLKQHTDIEKSAKDLANLLIKNEQSGIEDLKRFL